MTLSRKVAIGAVSAVIVLEVLLGVVSASEPPAPTPIPVELQIAAAVAQARFEELTEQMRVYCGAGALIQERRTKVFSCAPPAAPPVPEKKPDPPAEE